MALRLDNDCPECGKNVGYTDEAGDGDETTCRACGAELVCVQFEDDVLRWVIIDDEDEDDDEQEIAVNPFSDTGL